MVRLTNNIKHVALILKTAKEDKLPVASFQFSQGPVKIYNGGIGIHPLAFVPQSWKAVFATKQTPGRHTIFIRIIFGKSLTTAPLPAIGWRMITPFCRAFMPIFIHPLPGAIANLLPLLIFTEKACEQFDAFCVCLRYFSSVDGCICTAAYFHAVW